MKRIGDLLEKHRNLFLGVLLAATFLVSSRAGLARTDAGQPVSIPVMASASEMDAVSAFLLRRQADASADMAALEALIAREDVSADTREAAARQLTDLIAARQAQSAIEAALATSSLYPCVAVVDGSHVTLVTGKREISDRDSALVVELAALHAGAEAANVRIITAE